MAVPNHIRTLVLNGDMRPLGTVHWKKAMKNIFKSRGEDSAARLVEIYDIELRDTTGNIHNVPAVIANLRTVKRNYKRVGYSRKNVFKRDGFRCQYCAEKFKTSQLTVDHVIPRSIWSGMDSCTNWHNIVSCCYKCNGRKANRTPEQAGMTLRKVINGHVIPYKQPKKPNFVELVLGSSNLSLDFIPEEWRIYINYLMPKDMQKACAE